jgi:hypothetical protein
MARQKNLTIENAKIFWKNFSGRGSTFNAEGSRNFCVEIDKEDAKELKADGWNVKYSKPKEEGDEPSPYIQVTVAYGNYPPKIYLVTRKNRTLLDEDTVGELDRAEIEHVDLIISPYPWTVNGKSGIKAYCKTMYVTIEEDFGGRYSDYEYEEQLPFEE